jgi:hypothetical protein
MIFFLFPHFILVSISCIFHGYLTCPLLSGSIHYVYSLVVFRGVLEILHTPRILFSFFSYVYLAMFRVP